MRRAPVLIVGGGPAGAAAALALARGDFTPEVVERRQGPHDPVCGGFLSWRALNALTRLGIDPGALGARRIERARIFAGERMLEFDLPEAAAGLSRRRLDAALLSAAERAGAVVTRGRAVRSADPATRHVRLDTGEEIAAETLFLATGKHELRGLARPVRRPRSQTAVGLRAAVPLAAADARELAGTIELHLFDGGYAGALLQEDGHANICLSVSQRRLSQAGGIQSLLLQLAEAAPRLGNRIGPALTARWATIAGVPYGWRAGTGLPSVFRTGDQALVPASLVGDGLAAALQSGMGAADAFRVRGADAAPEWQADLSRRSRRSLVLGEALRSAAERDRVRTGALRIMQAVPQLARAAARLTRAGE